MVRKAVDLRGDLELSMREYLSLGAFPVTESHTSSPGHPRTNRGNTWEI